MGKVRKKPILVLTPGDPDGIGPELVWKILSKPTSIQKSISILCVGAREPFDRMGVPVVNALTGGTSLRRGLESPRSTHPFVWLVPAPSDSKNFVPGFQAGWSIQVATELVLDKIAAALVTGPISKERLQKGGFKYPGHTEFLADLCQAKSVTMMLTNEQLSVSLVTTHLPLQAVSKTLTRKLIRETVLNTVHYLRHYRRIKKPKISVAALNPHAGEKGLFGNEEIKIISPEIVSMQRASRGRFEIAGPFPADTLFARHILAPPHEKSDAVICMYHDQGLIPVKLSDFSNGLNLTLGLPFVRTSVDHGTAFDIAGKNIADPGSMVYAIRKAIEYL